MEEWDTSKSYDRLGVGNDTYEILDVSLPKIVIPVRPGRSLTAIVEVAARNQLLKVAGHHSAAEFQQRVQESLNLARRWDAEANVPRSLAAIASEEEIE